MNPSESQVLSKWGDNVGEEKSCFAIGMIILPTSGDFLPTFQVVFARIFLHVHSTKLKKDEVQPTSRVQFIVPLF